MLDRLGHDDRFTGGGALLVVVAAILPWYHFDSGSDRITQNAFGTGFLGDVAFLCGAAMLFVVLARRGIVAMPSQLGSRRVGVGIAAIALGAVILQLLIGVNGSGALHGASVGIVVALAGCAAMLGGAWMPDRVAASVARRR